MIASYMDINIPFKLVCNMCKGTDATNAFMDINVPVSVPFGQLNYYSKNQKGLMFCCSTCKPNNSWKCQSWTLFPEDYEYIFVIYFLDGIVHKCSGCWSNCDPFDGVDYDKYKCPKKNDNPNVGFYIVY